MQRATRDERRAFLATRIGSIVLPLLAAIIWGVIAYRAEVETTRRHAVDNAVLVGQYIERMIQTQTVIHSAVRVRAESEDFGFLRSRAFHEFLAGVEKNNASMRGVAVIGTDGTFVSTSRAFPIEGRFGPRAYLDAIAGGAGLFIDRIKLELRKEDAFVVASPLVMPDGQTYVIVSAVDSKLIADFLKGIATRTGDIASVMREDGLLMMRNVPSEPVMLPPDAAVRQAIKVDPVKGWMQTVAATDGVERFYAYHRMGDLPLYANFGTPTALVTATWIKRALPVWVLFAAIGLFAALTANRLRQRMAQRFELETAHRRVEAAEKLADERIRLMRETNHRVKNNLSLIVSLINMQMRGKAGIDGNELKARIGAISRVHDLMYQAADGVHVDFSETLREIADSPAIVPREHGISVICETETGIVLGPETTTPLAIIAAELLTNAVKHAFQGRTAGTIRVRLNRKGETGLMEVSDDGVGLPEVAPRRSGAAIIDALVHQIGGEISRDSGAEDMSGEGRGTFGLRMRVSFPLPAA